jgi:phosphatidylglycerophosphate synthase
VLSAIIAAALLYFSNPAYWLLAWAFIAIFEVLDCCDGEIARYRRTASLTGEFNDDISGVWFVFIILRITMCIGIYKATDNILIFIFGFLLLLGWVIYRVSFLLSLTLLYREGLVVQQPENKQVKTTRTFSKRIIGAGMTVFGHTGFFFTIPCIALLDMVLNPFEVGGLTFNTRFFYIGLVTGVLVAAASLSVYEKNKHGLR